MRAGSGRTRRRGRVGGLPGGDATDDPGRDHGRVERPLVATGARRGHDHQMASTVGHLGTLIRNADEHDWQWFLYISRPIDDCWSDTWAAVVEIDRYEEEPDPVTIVGVDYHPCLDVATIQAVRREAFEQLPNPSDDLLVASLRHYFHLDGFMPITADP